MKYAILAAVVVAPVAGHSLTLSTAAPNNGTGGVFMELTALANNLVIQSFDSYSGAAAGTTISLEVWIRNGSYAGFTASNAGWTLSETTSIVAAGTTTLAPISLVNQLAIAQGSTLSVYLAQASGSTGQGLRYTGTGAAPPQTTWSDGELQLFSDVARTGAIPFGGSQFTPRTFSGNVNYAVDAIPEPTTMAVLGLGAAALIRRRRK